MIEYNLSVRLYLIAQIAQSVEQRTENPRVTGSIPVLGILLKRRCYLVQLNKDGILAQSVEHLTFNQVVRGSNPRCLIKKNGGSTEKSALPLFLYIKYLIAL